jgi:uncharacterized protein (DUF2267 family)
MSVSELTIAERVAALLDIPIEDAEALTEATLRTLAQRISGGEAEDLAERLPEDLRPLLLKPREEAEAFPYEEFVDRVAQYADVDYTTAARAVAVVLRELREVVGEDEFEDAMAQLPREFRDLVTSQPE